MKRSAPAATGRGLRIVQNREDGLWLCTCRGSDLVRCNPPDGVPQRVVTLWIVAELTIPVFRNLKSEGQGTQVSDFTHEFNRRLWITILQFAIRRTHAAHRAQSALCAFCGTRCLPLANA